MTSTSAPEAPHEAGWTSAAEGSPVWTIRSLLTPGDIALLHATAEVVQGKQAPKQYDNDLLPQEEELPFGLRPRHESLFLHAGGHLTRDHPELWHKVIGALRKHHSTGNNLGVRCVEYHTYRIGGGLLDPQHRDNGSVLTLSALLTEPGTQFAGGVFTTFDARGQPVCHNHLACGDAVCFHSERVHNVSTVTNGVRCSLVVELWDKGDNAHDRHT